MVERERHAHIAGRAVSIDLRGLVGVDEIQALALGPQQQPNVLLVWTDAKGRSKPVIVFGDRFSIDPLPAGSVELEAFLWLGSDLRQTPRRFPQEPIEVEEGKADADA